MVRVLITEAHDGLGLALVKEYLTVTDNQVVAFCGDESKSDQLNTLKRSTSNKQLLIVPVNLADEESIKVSVEPIEGFVDALDLLIFNLGFIPSIFLDEDKVPEEMLMRFWNTIRRSPKWIKASFLHLLAQGDNSRVIGMHLCIPQSFDMEIWWKLHNIGAPMMNSCWLFRSFTHDVDPKDITVIHLSNIYHPHDPFDEKTLDEMDMWELVDQASINKKANVLFENIPKLPHGKHYYMEILHTMTAC